MLAGACLRGVCRGSGCGARPGIFPQAGAESVERPEDVEERGKRSSVPRSFSEPEAATRFLARSGACVWSRRSFRPSLSAERILTDH